VIGVADAWYEHPVDLAVGAGPVDGRLSGVMGSPAPVLLRLAFHGRRQWIAMAARTYCRRQLLAAIAASRVAS
jgi:hypothetical protein